MKRSKYSKEQITDAIRQAESGAPLGDVCRPLEISESTFDVWKKKVADATEFRELTLSRLRGDR